MDSRNNQSQNPQPPSTTPTVSNKIVPLPFIQSILANMQIPIPQAPVTTPSIPHSQNTHVVSEMVDEALPQTEAKPINVIDLDNQPMEVEQANNPINESHQDRPKQNQTIKEIPGVKVLTLPQKVDHNMMINKEPANTPQKQGHNIINLDQSITDKNEEKPNNLSFVQQIQHHTASTPIILPPPIAFPQMAPRNQSNKNTTVNTAVTTPASIVSKATFHVTTLLRNNQIPINQIVQSQLYSQNRSQTQVQHQSQPQSQIQNQTLQLPQHKKQQNQPQNKPQSQISPQIQSQPKKNPEHQVQQKPQIQNKVQTLIQAEVQSQPQPEPQPQLQTPIQIEPRNQEQHQVQIRTEQQIQKEPLFERQLQVQPVVQPQPQVEVHIQPEIQVPQIIPIPSQIKKPNPRVYQQPIVQAIQQPSTPVFSVQITTTIEEKKNQNDFSYIDVPPINHHNNITNVQIIPSLVLSNHPPAQLQQQQQQVMQNTQMDIQIPQPYKQPNQQLPRNQPQIIQINQDQQIQIPHRQKVQQNHAQPMIQPPIQSHLQVQIQEHIQCQPQQEQQPQPQPHPLPYVQPQILSYRQNLQVQERVQQQVQVQLPQNMKINLILQPGQIQIEKECLQKNIDINQPKKIQKQKQLEIIMPEKARQVPSHREQIVIIEEQQVQHQDNSQKMQANKQNQPNQQQFPTLTCDTPELTDINQIRKMLLTYLPPHLQQLTQSLDDKQLRQMYLDIRAQQMKLSAQTVQNNQNTQNPLNTNTNNIIILEQNPINNPIQPNQNLNKSLIVQSKKNEPLKTMTPKKTVKPNQPSNIVPVPRKQQKKDVINSNPLENSEVINNEALKSASQTGKKTKKVRKQRKRVVTTVVQQVEYYDDSDNENPSKYTLLENGQPKRRKPTNKAQMQSILTQLCTLVKSLDLAALGNNNPNQ